MTDTEEIREELNNQSEPEITAEENSAAGNAAVQTAVTHRKPARRGWLRMLLAFAAGFCACIGVFAAVMYGADYGRIVSKADYDYFVNLNNNFGKYNVIFDLIGEDPLVKETPEEITDAAVKEMVSELDDPYAVYFTPEEYKEFSKQFEGGYVGIGIVVLQTDDGLIVGQIFDDGPADKGGMEEGDEIIRVDGVTPENIEDAVARMTGEDGTDVTVTVRRDGKEIDLKMTRAEINIDSVSYSKLEDNPEVGYIHLMVFAEDSADEVKEAVEELQKQGCDKFILDLRDNGGGMTNVSIDIADYLLPECRIMTEINKKGEKTEYDSEESSADLDLVVLVNENTASASEILTAAIQENNAGKVIGTRTYGKGVTQVSRQFKDGSAIKMTVTEYLTPKGNHVHEKGIEPDIEATDENIMDKAIEELNN